jgi:type III secretory pathway component EscS
MALVSSIVGIAFSTLAIDQATGQIQDKTKGKT